MRLWVCCERGMIGVCCVGRAVRMMTSATRLKGGCGSRSQTNQSKICRVSKQSTHAYNSKIPHLTLSMSHHIVVYRLTVWLVVLVLGLWSVQCVASAPPKHCESLWKLPLPQTAAAASSTTSTTAAMAPWLFSMHAGDIHSNLTTAARAFQLILDIGAFFSQLLVLKTMHPKQKLTLDLCHEPQQCPQWQADVVFALTCFGRTSSQALTVGMRTELPGITPTTPLPLPWELLQ